MSTIEFDASHVSEHPRRSHVRVTVSRAQQGPRWINITTSYQTASGEMSTPVTIRVRDNDVLMLVALLRKAEKTAFSLRQRDERNQPAQPNEETTES